MLLRALSIIGKVKMGRDTGPVVNPMDPNTDPVTSLNQNSAYVFSTGNTTIGSVTVTKRTATNGGQAWSNPTYDATSSTMTFNGTNQAVAYLPNSQIQVAPLPFSFQVDFNTDKITGNQYIMNLGQGNGVGFPCLHIILNGSTLNLTKGTTNATGSSTTYNVGTVAAGQWYRLCVMFYRVNTTNFLRVYLNGVVTLQQTIGTSTTNAAGQGGIPRSVPTNGTAGLAFGSDNANYSGYNFKGKLRYIFMGNSAFWAI